MALKNFELTEKKELTHDVFELDFKCNEVLEPFPGQFITFLLPAGIGGKAYSILDCEGDILKLIIKRVENGGGGSKFICDSKIGDILKGVGPTGKFILQENNKNKLFFGTGTGFVPLYYQIIKSLEKSDSKLKLVFGVRKNKDLFYINELKRLKQENKNFYFAIFLSQEESEEYYYGRITNFINTYNIGDFKEFYICGNPIMVDDVEEKLLSLEVPKEDIFSEKY